MMRFRCPHCQQVLEVIQLTNTLLCPACERWCRIPIPDEFELGGGPTGEIPPAKTRVPFEPRLAPSEPPVVPRSEAITAQRADELPLRLRDEDEIEDVPLEVVEDGEDRRPRRRRRRRRRSSGFDLDYWISPSLILLVLLAPGSLFLVGLSFFVHPGAGFGALFMVVGGIWLILIAAEDSLMTALMVLFVPFYYWYFAFVNFERVAVPFLMNCIGSVIFVVSLVTAGNHGAESSWRPPHPAVRVARYHIPWLAESASDPLQAGGYGKKRIA